MLAIFKRELRSCFHGMIGAVLTAFMLAATAIYFVALNLGYGLPDFGYYTLCRSISSSPVRRAAASTCCLRCACFTPLSSATKSRYSCTVISG